MFLIKPSASLNLLAVVLLSASVSMGQVEEQRKNPFAEMLERSASPNAKGPMANTIVTVTAKKHTHYTFDQAMTVDATGLARGLTELKYIFRVVELAKQGATVYISVDQPNQMVDSTNVDQVLASISKRLSDYQRATEQRGFETLAPAYDLIEREVRIPTLLEQDNGNLNWWDGESLYTGAIVEDTFVIASDIHTELTMIGKTSLSDKMSVQIWAADWGSENEELVSETIWQAKSGNESRYALAYISRAMYYLHRAEFAKALDDANAALKRDPLLTTGYAIRSQILSSCPIDHLRSADRALADAKKYCELKVKTGEDKWGEDKWACHTLLAAAYAESGDFAAATAEANLAVKDAPEEMRASIQSDLDKYVNQQPRRME